MTEETAPLTIEEFAALLAPLLPAGEEAALAVSGGPDSLALAWCAKRAGIPCRAFIVDHKLRPESSDEAQEVRKRLAAMGIEAEILVWDHGALESRIHVEARRGRYALLIEACKRRGCKNLLLAHHRDDQAETILMRLSKGSGIEGLGGMTAVKEMNGVRLLRPFLSVPKARLVATCEAAGLSFVRDPSNEKEKYARGRLRRVMGSLAEEGLTVERLLDLGERAAEAAAAIDHYAKKFLQTAAVDLSGAVSFEAGAFEKLPQAVALKVLSLCFLTIRPAPFAPERKKLLALYRHLLNDRQTTQTLGGILARRKKDILLFRREPASVIDSQSIAPGQTILWDGRWGVAFSGGQGGEIRPLGFQPHTVLDALAPGLRKKLPQGRARAVLPALWREGKLTAIPSFSKEKQGGFAASLLPPLWR